MKIWVKINELPPFDHLIFQTLIILTIMTDSVLQYKLYEYPSLTKQISWCITFIPLLPLLYAAVLCYRNDFSSFRQVSIITFNYLISFMLQNRRYAVFVFINGLQFFHAINKTHRQRFRDVLHIKFIVKPYFKVEPKFRIHWFEQEFLLHIHNALCTF